MELSISSLYETEDWCLSWLSISYNVHLTSNTHPHHQCLGEQWIQNDKRLSALT